MSFGPLSADEHAELDTILDARSRLTARRALRCLLLQTDVSGALRVHCVVHLLDQAVETELRQQLRVLDDRIAVVRHCRLDTDRARQDLRSTETERNVLAGRLDERCRAIDARFRVAPVSGPDWSIADVAPTVTRQVRALHDHLRRAVVRIVDDIVDSDLLELNDPNADHDLGAVVRCADTSDETSARVKAFIAEIDRLAAIDLQATERLRFEALRAPNGTATPWIARQTARRKEALAAIDATRAMHAAIVEVEAACQLMCGDGQTPVPSLPVDFAVESRRERD